MDSIHVEGAGELRLPLSTKDIIKIRTVGEKSAFGWQVNISKVTFPGTPKFISKTIQLWALKAVRELGRNGVAVQLEACPDKLMVFERNGHFKFHGEKEKAKRIFAKFIIQLPTEEGFKGGELVVRHNNSTKTFDWLNRISKIGFCYTVLFGDCKYEVQRIISGTLVCLVFDLVRLDPTSDEALYQALISCKVREAEAALQPWVQDVMKENFTIFSKKLAIPLEHKYKAIELSFAKLKGDDNTVAEVLKSCRDKGGERLLDLHLCLVTKFQHGNYVERDEQNYGYDSDFEEYFEDDAESEDSIDDDAKDRIMRDVRREEISIKGWIGLDDEETMAFQGLQMDVKKEVVVGEGKEPFGTEPDLAKYRRHKHESDCTLKHWYSRAMILVWPKDISSSLACETSVSGALDLLECRLEISDSHFCDHLHRIVRYYENNVSRVWKQVLNHGSFAVTVHEDSVTPRLLHLCAKASMVDDLALVLKLLLVKTNFDVTYMYEQRVAHFRIGVRNFEVAKWIATVVQMYGWEVFSSIIIELVKKCALSQGPPFAQLAKDLISFGKDDAGAIVIDNIIEVFQARSKELENRINDLEQHKEPEFTWCQPDAKLPLYPDVEQFLKGPQERLCYECRFWNIYSDARSFAKRYFESDKVKDGYSATANAGGGRKTGLKPFCDIKKSTHFFDVAMSRYTKVQEELKPLRLELEEIKSFVIQTKAIIGNVPANEASQHDRKRQRQNTEDARDSVLEVTRKKDKKTDACNFIDLSSED